MSNSLLGAIVVGFSLVILAGLSHLLWRGLRDGVVSTELGGGIDRTTRPRAFAAIIALYGVFAVIFATFATIGVLHTLGIITKPISLSFCIRPHCDLN